MRIGVVALVIAGLGAVASADDRDEAVARLPVIATLEGGRTTVVIRGALRRADRRRAARLARQVYDDFNRRFARPLADGERRRPPVDLCLLPTERAYRAFADALYGEREHPGYGFYMPADRLVVINWARSANNIRHELLHPLLGDDFPRLPSWLNEGFASLYTTSRFHRGAPRFRDNYRLRQVRRALRDGTLPTWRQLARSGRAEIYGRAQGTYYATARYLLFYLAQRRKLVSFYRELRAGPVTAERQQRLLERYVDRRAFVRWLRRR